MTDGGAGLGSPGYWVCKNTLLPHAHWHYNIDTVSVTSYSAHVIQWYKQRYTFTHPCEPPSFYSYHTNPPLGDTQEILLRLREVALESAGWGIWLEVPVRTARYHFNHRICCAQAKTTETWGYKVKWTRDTITAERDHNSDQNWRETLSLPTRGLLPQSLTLR